MYRTHMHTHTQKRGQITCVRFMITIEVVPLYVEVEGQCLRPSRCNFEDEGRCLRLDSKVHRVFAKKY